MIYTNTHNQSSNVMIARRTPALYFHFMVCIRTTKSMALSCRVPFPSANQLKQGKQESLLRFVLGQLSVSKQSSPASQDFDFDRERMVLLTSSRLFFMESGSVRLAPSALP